MTASEAPTVRLRDPAPVRPRWLLRLVVGALLVAAVIVGGTAFRVWQVARVDDRRPVDAVVVLGAAQYDGEPSSIFSWRRSRPMSDTSARSVAGAPRPIARSACVPAA